MSSLSNAFRNGSCSRVTKSVLSYVSYENGFETSAVYRFGEDCMRAWISTAAARLHTESYDIEEKFMVKSVIIVVLQ